MLNGLGIASRLAIAVLTAAFVAVGASCSAGGSSFPGEMPDGDLPRVVLPQETSITECGQSPYEAELCSHLARFDAVVVGQMTGMVPEEEPMIALVDTTPQLMPSGSSDHCPTLLPGLRIDANVERVLVCNGDGPCPTAGEVISAYFGREAISGWNHAPGVSADGELVWSAQGSGPRPIMPVGLRLILPLHWTTANKWTLLNELIIAEDPASGRLLTQEVASHCGLMELGETLNEMSLPAAVDAIQACAVDARVSAGVENYSPDGLDAEFEPGLLYASVCAHWPHDSTEPK